MHATIWVIIVLSLAFTAYFLLKNGEPDALWWWPLGLLFFAWTCLPFALVIWFLRTNSESVRVLGVSFVTVAIMAIGGGFLLRDAFVVHLDPQSALILVVLPFCQLVIAGIGLAAANAVNARTKT